MGQDDQLDELQHKLEAAREARAAAEAKRAARFAADDLSRAIAAETREAEEQEVLEELEVKHGREGVAIWRVPTTAGMVVVRKPTPAKYRGFVDRGKGDQNTSEQFVREFVVYPTDKEALNAIISAQPGTIKRCMDALIYLAGIRPKEDLPGKSQSS